LYATIISAVFLAKYLHRELASHIEIFSWNPIKQQLVNKILEIIFFSKQNFELPAALETGCNEYGIACSML